MVFAKGDRVMCINGYESQGRLTSGVIYTVESTPDPFTIGAPKIALKELAGIWFLQSRFVLAINEQSPYTVWEKGNTNHV